MKKTFLILLSSILAISSTSFVLAEESSSAERTAAPYMFELSDAEEKYIENLIFNEDVIISGDNANIMFINCEFNGDIINTAEEGTRVMIMENSVVNGKCIFQNNTHESTLEASFPKFMTDTPIEVINEDCFGTVVTFGDFEITFNGDTYSMADSELFFDNGNPEAGYVPYEGQEAQYFIIAQWWENGEKQIFKECEFDPSV